jgi:hypothetical protein
MGKTFLFLLLLATGVFHVGPIIGFAMGKLNGVRRKDLARRKNALRYGKSGFIKNRKGGSLSRLIYFIEAFLHIFDFSIPFS